MTKGKPRGKKARAERQRRRRDEKVLAKAFEQQTREVLISMQSICPHNVAMSSDTSFARCGRCAKRWAMIPIDWYENPEHEGAKQVIADALREGRDEDAIAIYVEVNWKRLYKSIEGRVERARDGHSNDWPKVVAP